MLDSGCCRYGKEGHYSLDYSQREPRLCFICSHPGHSKVDFPLRSDGIVLDPTPSCWQLPDGRHGTTGSFMD